MRLFINSVVYRLLGVAKGKIVLREQAANLQATESVYRATLNSLGSNAGVLAIFHNNWRAFLVRRFFDNLLGNVSLSQSAKDRNHFAFPFGPSPLLAGFLYTASVERFNLAAVLPNFCAPLVSGLSRNLPSIRAGYLVRRITRARKMSRKNILPRMNNFFVDFVRLPLSLLTGLTALLPGEATSGGIAVLRRSLVRFFQKTNGIADCSSEIFPTVLPSAFGVSYLQLFSNFLLTRLRAIEPKHNDNFLYSSERFTGALFRDVRRVPPILIEVYAAKKGIYKRPPRKRRTPWHELNWMERFKRTPLYERLFVRQDERRNYRGRRPKVRDYGIGSMFSITNMNSMMLKFDFPERRFRFLRLKYLYHMRKIKRFLTLRLFKTLHKFGLNPSKLKNLAFRLRKAGLKLARSRVLGSNTRHSHAYARFISPARRILKLSATRHLKTSFIRAKNKSPLLTSSNASHNALLPKQGAGTYRPNVRGLKSLQDRFWVMRLLRLPK